MSKIVIENKIDYIKEAFCLLGVAGSEKSYANEKKDYERKNNNPSKAVLSKYDFLSSVESRMRKKLKGYEEDMKYYFGRSSSEGRNIGEMILVEDSLNPRFTDLEAVKEYWSGLSKKDYIEGFDEQIYMFSSAVYDFDDTTYSKDEIDIIRKIHAMDISQELKWKIQDVFLFPDKHREKISKLLELAIEVIDESEDRIKSYNDEFQSYWMKKLENISVSQYLSEKLNITLDENEYGYILRSNIFMPNSVTIHAEDKNSKDNKINSPYTMRFGFLFDDDYTFVRNEPSIKYEEKAISALKLLSDKSKFEILSMLKNKKTYGGELARSLNLTPATISHHMSALLSARIVKIEKEDNKIYYETNVEELEKIFSFCKEKLI